MPTPPDIDRSTPILKQRMADVFRPLPRAMSGSERHLHDMRIAARRLRVALPLLACRPGKKRVRRSVAVLRELTRAAGGSRDFDVGVALFDEQLQAAPRPEALRVLRRRLLAARARSRLRMADALLDLEIAGLRRHLRAILARRGDAQFTVVLRLRQERDALGVALRGGLLALGDRYAPEELHQLRIKARRLRYTAELDDLLRGRDSGAAEIFRELQDQLGRIHDRYVASRWFGAQVVSSRARGQRLVATQAEAECGLFLQASRECHRKLLAARPLDLVQAGLAALGATRPPALGAGGPPRAS